MPGKYRENSECRYDYSKGPYGTPPYLEVNPYQRRIAFVAEGSCPGAFMNQAIANECASRALFTGDADALRALVGERLYARARAETGLAETVAELTGSINEIYRGTGRLVKSYQELRRGKVGKAFRTLGVRRRKADGPWWSAKAVSNRSLPRRLRKKARRHRMDTLASSADAFVVWSWAVVPTVQSIADSVEFLQKHPISTSYKTSARNRVLWEWADQYDLRSYSAEVRAYAGFHVRLVNPNLALADAYGFLNPVKLGWQLIPASFLVDFFVPVSRFLGAFSPLYGREVSRAYTSLIARGPYETFHKRTQELRRWNTTVFKRETGIRENYQATDVLRLKLPPTEPAATVTALAVKTFRNR